MDQPTKGLPLMKFMMNFNNKLHCRSFTTIRTPERKWAKGSRVALVEGPELYPRGVAVVAFSRKVTIRELTNEMALADIGYLKTDLVRMLHEAYGEYIKRNGGEDAALVLLTMLKADEYYQRHDAPLLGQEGTAMAFVPLATQTAEPAGRKHKPIGATFEMFPV